MKRIYDRGFFASLGRPFDGKVLQMQESNDRQIVINHCQEGDPSESILDNQGYRKCFHELQSNSSMLRIVTK